VVDRYLAGEAKGVVPAVEQLAPLVGRLWRPPTASHHVDDASNNGAESAEALDKFRSKVRASLPFLWVANVAELVPVVRALSDHTELLDRLQQHVVAWWANTKKEIHAALRQEVCPAAVQ
jgi:hypothetical protein